MHYQPLSVPIATLSQQGRFRNISTKEDNNYIDGRQRSNYTTNNTGSYGWEQPDLLHVVNRKLAVAVVTSTGVPSTLVAAADRCPSIFQFSNPPCPQAFFSLPDCFSQVASVVCCPISALPKLLAKRAQNGRLNIAPSAGSGSRSQYSLWEVRLLLIMVALCMTVFLTGMVRSVTSVQMVGLMIRTDLLGYYQDQTLPAQLGR